MRYSPENHTPYQKPHNNVYQSKAKESIPKNPIPPEKPDFSKEGKKSKNILEKFLPESIYNPRTKKLLGILSPEELLLVALIFLFADSDKEDSPIMCLVLLYLLFSDKFNDFFK